MIYLVITCIIFFILCFADQLTKYLAQRNAWDGFEAIPHVLRLDCQYNTGMAWSLLDNMTWFLVIVSILATILLGFIAMKNNWKKAKLNSIGITLALAGCFSNLIDRTIAIIPYYNKLSDGGRPGVVDMIILEPLDNLFRAVFKSSFPVFNLADAFLVVGLIIFAIDELFLKERRENGKNKSRRKVS